MKTVVCAGFITEIISQGFCGSSRRSRQDYCRPMETNMVFRRVDGKCQWRETMHVKMCAFVTLIVLFGFSGSNMCCNSESIKNQTSTDPGSSDIFNDYL